MDGCSAGKEDPAEEPSFHSSDEAGGGKGNALARTVHKPQTTPLPKKTTELREVEEEARTKIEEKRQQLRVAEVKIQELVAKEEESLAVQKKNLVAHSLMLEKRR